MGSSHKAHSKNPAVVTAMAGTGLLSYPSTRAGHLIPKPGVFLLDSRTSDRNKIKHSC